jgi:outer membrane protein insertion porin family
MAVLCAAWAPPRPVVPPVALDVAPPATAASVEGSPRVIFEGNRDISSLELVQALVGGPILSPAFDMSLLRQVVPPETAFALGDPPSRAELRIVGLYYDRGYLAASVDPPEVRQNGPYTDVRLHIVEGPRFRLRRLGIDERDPDGRVVPPLGHVPLRSFLSLQDGEWFSRGVLVKDLASVRTFYRNAGYANVDAEPETDLDTAAAPPTVDVTIAVHRGPIVAVDSVVIRGNHRLSSEAIRAIIAILPGQRFSEAKLDEARRRLLATGDIASVDVSVEAGPSESRVTTTFEVTER